MAGVELSPCEAIPTPLEDLDFRDLRFDWTNNPVLRVPYKDGSDPFVNNHAQWMANRPGVVGVERRDLPRGSDNPVGAELAVAFESKDAMKAWATSQDRIMAGPIAQAHGAEFDGVVRPTPVVARFVRQEVAS